MFEAGSALTALMRQGVDEGVFPGGVLAWSCRGEIYPPIVAGTLGRDNPAAVRCDTVFDLASLTKPLAAAAVCLKLAESGILDLDMPVSAIMGPFIPPDKAQITLAMLLGHTAGLPAWRPYFEALRELRASQRKQALLKMVLTEPLESSPGTTVVYSDLGYILLTFVLEALTGKDLAALSQERIYLPLGLRLVYNVAGIPLASEVAPTENCPWRGQVLQGCVHDDNAWAAGFPLGHAGLFGTAADVLKLAETFRLSAKAPGGFFDYALMTRFLRKTPDSDKRLGFEAPSLSGASCGGFSAESFGHLGFTGTSFWVDPVRELTAVLLSNRVNFGRDNLLIRAFRPRVHNLLLTFYNTANYG